MYDVTNIWLGVPHICAMRVYIEKVCVTWVTLISIMGSGGQQQHSRAMACVRSLMHPHNLFLFLQILEFRMDYIFQYEFQKI